MPAHFRLYSLCNHIYMYIHQPLNISHAFLSYQKASYKTSRVIRISNQLHLLTRNNNQNLVQHLQFWCTSIGKVYTWEFARNERHIKDAFGMADLSAPTISPLEVMGNFIVFPSEQFTSKHGNFMAATAGITILFAIAICTSIPNKVILSTQK